MNYKEVLNKLGLLLYNTCNCGGIYKEKFRTASMVTEVWVMPRKNTFKVLQMEGRHRTSKGSGFLESLEQYLQTIQVN